MPSSLSPTNFAAIKSAIRQPNKIRSSRSSQPVRAEPGLYTPAPNFSTQAGPQSVSPSGAVYVPASRPSSGSTSPSRVRAQGGRSTQAPPMSRAPTPKQSPIQRIQSPNASIPTKPSSKSAPTPPPRYNRYSSRVIPSPFPGLTNPFQARSQTPGINLRTAATDPGLFLGTGLTGARAIPAGTKVPSGYGRVSTSRIRSVGLLQGGLLTTATNPFVGVESGLSKVVPRSFKNYLARNRVVLSDTGTQVVRGKMVGETPTAVRVATKDFYVAKIPKVQVSSEGFSRVTTPYRTGSPSQPLDVAFSRRTILKESRLARQVLEERGTTQFSPSDQSFLTVRGYKNRLEPKYRFKLNLRKGSIVGRRAQMSIGRPESPVTFEPIPKREVIPSKLSVPSRASPSELMTLEGLSRVPAKVVTSGFRLPSIPLPVRPKVVGVPVSPTRTIPSSNRVTGNTNPYPDTLPQFKIDAPPAPSPATTPTSQPDIFGGSTPKNPSKPVFGPAAPFDFYPTRTPYRLPRVVGGGFGLPGFAQKRGYSFYQDQKRGPRGILNLPSLTATFEKGFSPRKAQKKIKGKFYTGIEIRGL